MAADLVDATGKFISHTVARQAVGSGSRTFTLNFPGNEIFAVGANGPYRLTNVIVVGYRQAMLVLTEAKDVYTTAAYDYHRFAPRLSRPVVSAGGPYTVEEGESVELTAIGNDPEGDPLTYAWDLDGDGVFETAGVGVLLRPISGWSTDSTRGLVPVSDPQGFSAVGQTMIDVVNKAPIVSVSPKANTMRGQPFSAVGSFADVDSDTWTGTVDYGDG